MEDDLEMDLELAGEFNDAVEVANDFKPIECEELEMHNAERSASPSWPVSYCEKKPVEEP